MNSRILTGHIKHERLLPVKHTLQYPLYLYCLDLDELVMLDRALPCFGYNRFRPASLYDADYLDNSGGSIKEKLLRFLVRNGYGGQVSSVLLITSARYFNYVFNPVSFYCCFAKNGDLACIVVEVNNTFGERHVYIPEGVPEPHKGLPARFTAAKAFHVSPFNDMAGRYEFILSNFRDTLNVRINLHRDDKLAFYAELWGDMRPLTAANHIKAFLKYPLVPHLSIPRIYWQAAKLFFHKKLPYHPKSIQ